MENNILEIKIQEINNLIKRKQFIPSEQKSRDLIKQININNENYELYISTVLLLAETLSKNVKNIKALEELEVVLELYPFEIRLLNEIFELSLKLKRYSRAESALKTIINIQPDNLNNRIKLAKLYIDKKDYSLAIFELNDIIALGIYEENIYLMLIDCLEKEGLYHEELKQIKILQEISPDNISLIVYEAEALLKTNNRSMAFELVDNLINYKINSSEIDEELIVLLDSYSSLYEITGQRYLLGEALIKILSCTEKILGNLKIRLEKFADKMKWNLIFNYITKNQIIIKYDKLSEKEIIENISLLNENYINENQVNTLDKYLKKCNLPDMINKNYLLFLR